jgi:hypothetical protein
VQAEFSSKVPGVQLFWQDSLWGDMGPDNAPQKVNTYRGHVWNVRKGDDIVHTFKVSGRNEGLGCSLTVVFGAVTGSMPRLPEKGFIHLRGSVNRFGPVCLLVHLAGQG